MWSLTSEAPEHFLRIRLQNLCLNHKLMHISKAESRGCGTEDSAYLIK